MSAEPRMIMNEPVTVEVVISRKSESVTERVNALVVETMAGSEEAERISMKDDLWIASNGTIEFAV